VSEQERRSDASCCRFTSTKGIKTCSVKCTIMSASHVFLGSNHSDTLSATRKYMGSVTWVSRISIDECKIEPYAGEQTF
jgi:hypothetical protein